METGTETETIHGVLSTTVQQPIDFHLGKDIVTPIQTDQIIKGVVMTKVDLARKRWFTWSFTSADLVGNERTS